MQWYRQRRLDLAPQPRLAAPSFGRWQGQRAKTLEMAGELVLSFAIIGWERGERAIGFVPSEAPGRARSRYCCVRRAFRPPAGAAGRSSWRWTMQLLCGCPASVAQRLRFPPTESRLGVSSVLSPEMKQRAGGRDVRIVFDEATIARRVGELGRE